MNYNGVSDEAEVDKTYDLYLFKVILCAIEFKRFNEEPDLLRRTG